MWYRTDSSKTTLYLYIQPGATKTCIDGMHKSALKIRLQAPPADGKANKALIQFLAQIFAVRKNQIEIKQGLQSRHKTVLINHGSIHPTEIYSASSTHALKPSR